MRCVWVNHDWCIAYFCGMSSHCQNLEAITFSYYFKIKLHAEDMKDVII